MIEELYKKYYEELINWCHSMTGNLYTAEELVHEYMWYIIRKVFVHLYMLDMQTNVRELLHICLLYTSRCV